MCLTLGGGEMMQPMFPPTDAVKMHKTRLQILAFIHLALFITMMAMGGPMNFSTICTIMCLFCATMNYNYCCVLIYIVYTLFDAITMVDPVGAYIQDSITGRPYYPR